MSLYEAVVVSVDWGKRRASIEFVFKPGQVYEARMVLGNWVSGLCTEEIEIKGGAHEGHVSVRPDGYIDPYNSSLGVHNHGVHKHNLAPVLKPGDRVLVGLMHGRSESPVILDRLLV